MNFLTDQFRIVSSLLGNKAPLIRQIRHWYSPTLHRNVDLDIFLPPNYTNKPDRHYPLLLLNDGQDLTRAKFAYTLRTLYETKQLPYVIVVGIYCGPNRMREYGTARQADYKGRGDLAGAYSHFIRNELLPFVRQRFRVSHTPADTVFAGFSLGGLSALDIVWANPSIFGSAGIFSGSLWWRWAPVRDGDPDADRIMHHIISTSVDQRPNDQRFWFQVGALDEAEDRNNNGVIDAIDDTIDCIRELKRRGYHNEQIRYYEMSDGHHDPETWGRAMPDFLRWTFSMPGTAM
jgi:enterochelin esterase-like enzyme